jgi:pimeloyl-ACP methyl ester carboxylesterase
MQVKRQNKPDGIARLMGSIGRDATPPDPGKIKCPVLLIAAEKDIHMGVEQGKQEQKAIPGSKLEVFPTGHASAIEMPEKFNSVVLDFLSG